MCDTLFFEYSLGGEVVAVSVIDRLLRRPLVRVHLLRPRAWAAEPRHVCDPERDRRGPPGFARVVVPPATTSPIPPRCATRGISCLRNASSAACGRRPDESGRREAGRSTPPGSDASPEPVSRAHAAARQARPSHQRAHAPLPLRARTVVAVRVPLHPSPRLRRCAPCVRPVCGGTRQRDRRSGGSDHRPACFAHSLNSGTLRASARDRNGGGLVQGRSHRDGGHRDRHAAQQRCSGWSSTTATSSPRTSRARCASTTSAS